MNIKRRSKIFSYYIKECWGVPHEEFVSKLPVLLKYRYIFGSQFKHLLFEKLNKRFSDLELAELDEKFYELFVHSSMLNRVILPNSKILCRWYSVDDTICKEFIKTLKAQFQEFKFVVDIINSEKEFENLKMEYNDKALKILGSKELLQVDSGSRLRCNGLVKIVGYKNGIVYEGEVKKLEEHGAKLNYKLFEGLDKLNEEYIAYCGDTWVRRLYSSLLRYCSKTGVKYSALDFSGYLKNLQHTWINRYSDECHVIYNYQKLKIEEVFFKWQLDNLYQLKSYGNCSLNGSQLINYLIYFTPGYKELSFELKKEYMDNLKYYYMSNSTFRRLYKTKDKAVRRYKYEKLTEDGDFGRFAERVAWCCIENNLDTTIKVVSNISLLPMVALILKNKRYLDMSGVFSAEWRIGVYQELVKELRALPEYIYNWKCGIEYKIVHPVVEMYLLGYSESEMLVTYEYGGSGYSLMLKPNERKLLIKKIISKLKEIIPELVMLIKFMRRYVEYKIKRCGYISSKLEDSQIDYYYTNGKKEEVSLLVMRKRILGDRLKLLNNKIKYNCMRAMVNKSVSQSCYIEGDKYIIHPCDLNNLILYYNEEIVKVKNMSLWEIMCDGEIKDENSEFYKANKKLIENLNKTIENKSTIKDQEIMRSKYTIVPYNPEHEFENLKGHPGLEWWSE